MRTLLARALVVEPDILLLDEPFSGLDVLTAETLRTDFLELWAENRTPIRAVLTVTHNIEEAVLMCDRVLVFSPNPGRITAEIPIRLPHPRNRHDPAFRHAQGEPQNVAAGGILQLDRRVRVGQIAGIARVLKMVQQLRRIHFEIVT